MPPDVSFIAGFVHDLQDLATQEKIQNQIVDRIGHPVDVAAPRGLGRRNRAQAQANLALNRRLAGE